MGTPPGAPLPPPGPAPIFAPPGTPTATDAVLQQLTASISRQTDEAKAQNEILNRQLEYNIDKEEKKKDRFKKLHSSTKQLILFASAKDATNVPTEVNEDCKRFINSETVGVAEQELNQQFKKLGLQDAASQLALPKRSTRENSYGRTRPLPATSLPSPSLKSNPSKLPTNRTVTSSSIWWRRKAKGRH